MTNTPLSLIIILSILVVNCSNNSNKVDTEEKHAEPINLKEKEKEASIKPEDSAAEEFLNLFPSIKIELKQKYEIVNARNSDVGDLLNAKFYRFLHSSVDTNFSVYPIEHFHFDDNMDGIILWHEKEEERPIIELFFWDRTKQKFFNESPITLYDIDEKENIRTHFSSYITDINNDGNFDIISRTLTGQMEGYNLQSITEKYKVQLINDDYEVIESKAEQVDFTQFWETEESVLKELLYNKNGWKVYKNAAYNNDEVLYNTALEQHNFLLLNDMIGCPAYLEASYSSLSLVNNIYSYNYSASETAACGYPGINQRVYTININTGQPASIVDLVEEVNFVNAFKADGWVKRNVSQSQLDTCQNVNDINQILEPYSPESVGFAVVKYDEVNNQLHFRIIAYPFDMKPEALQLGFVLPPKASIKNQLLNSDNFYMTTFKNYLYH